MKLETNSFFGHKIAIKISTVYKGLALPFMIILGDFWDAQFNLVMKK
jgi:hypothetical protein